METLTCHSWDPCIIAVGKCHHLYYPDVELKVQSASAYVTFQNLHSLEQVELGKQFRALASRHI